MKRKSNQKKYEKLIIILALVMTALLIVVINIVGSPMGGKASYTIDKTKTTLSASDNKKTDNASKNEVTSV